MRTVIDVFPRRKEFNVEEIFGPAESYSRGFTVGVMDRDGYHHYEVKGGRLRRKRWVRRG